MRAGTAREVQQWTLNVGHVVRVDHHIFGWVATFRWQRELQWPRDDQFVVVLQADHEAFVKPDPLDLTVFDPLGDHDGPFGLR